MQDALIENRVQQLLKAPGGCTLLLMAAESRLAPAEIVEPVTARHLVANAVGHITPWRGDHDAVVWAVLEEGRHHRALAAALLREPGIERWWAPVDREEQVWMEPESRIDLQSADEFPTPEHSPSRFEIYAQRPYPQVSTSTEVDGWTSQLAGVVDHSGDWHMNYPARRARIQVQPDARVYEVASAEDWHLLVSRHGVRNKPKYRSDPKQSPQSHIDFDQPWGPNDGLVPDWQAIADVWGGVHVTLWGLLTATQVRVESEAGWSELWSWEAEETVWLNWVFEAVEPLPTLETLPNGSQFPMPFGLH